MILFQNFLNISASKSPKNKTTILHNTHAQKSNHS